MKEIDRLSGIKVCVKGGGDIASGVAWRLHQCGFKVFITEIDQPVAVRRKVAFCEAVYEGKAVVQGVEALLIHDVNDVCPTWDQGKIPILIDTYCRARYIIKPEVIVDAIMAKKNIGSSINDAPLVIALGPGFEAGRDAHLVVESHRRHNLGRLLAVGSAQPDTGVPGPVLGITTDRVLRAPADGLWQSAMKIGDLVEKGDSVGSVAGVPVKALIEGVLRGMIRPGINVQEGLKIGDVDPRARREYCDTISDKALAIGGGVLEGILRFYFQRLSYRKP
jgi:xanthine dehydrogenase accessory factor